ncbi:GNAT family N-acetyltransferase [Luteibacter aegosomatissinici]|uniref:GNAT family N-acetyltransferase n=1 Tax=Luteibacter aegosomatissinici TaxID=2911539 RepID=UPI001FF88313|nr:GNAT family N-acetyltransferase [Luteibacter aegosomatissinici]UPG96613.1 GNAT family N-acetyltransferase [Luteibacter aegosomatissinici]
MASTFTVSVPRLQTERFLLREYRPEDFEAFAAHLSDPESMTHLNVSDRKLAWRVFGSHAGLWLLGGAGWWAIERKDTGELVGNVGAFFRDGMPGMELGWNTYRTFWGQGVAPEAAAAVLAYAFDVRREPRVHALINADNRASIRVAERLGLRYHADTELNGKMTGKYTRETETSPLHGGAP